MDDELQDDALMSDDYKSITTDDGRVIWVPCRHAALLEEWSWCFDTTSLVAYRIDAEKGIIALPEQMASNLAIRGPKDDRQVPYISSWLLFRMYGHLPEYTPFLKQVLQIRVKLLQHMGIEMLDAHTLLSTIHMATHIMYLRWIRAQEYLIQTTDGPVQMTRQPAFETLGQWGRMALFRDEEIFRPLGDRVRQMIVDIWDDSMNDDPESSLTGHDCELMLKGHKLSAAVMLELAISLVFAGVCPEVIS